MKKGGLPAGIRHKLDQGRKGAIDVNAIKAEQERDFKLDEFDRFRYRTRYFIDSGVIGSREFVDRERRFSHIVVVYLK